VLFLIASALIATGILIITHIQREKALSKIEVIHSGFEIYSEEITPDKVNINTDSLEELESLPNIGPKIAKRIIEYRNTHGGFQSIEDITKVKGIGPKTFDKIKEMITVGFPTTNSSKKLETLPTRSSAIATNRTEKVNINTDSLEELESLPNIGPGIAKRIIEYRNTHGGFQSIEDITKVKGIGPKTFDKIKEMITVGSPTSEISTKEITSEKVINTDSSKKLETLPTRSSAIPTNRTEKVNINTDSLEELESLPNIGPGIAKRIIEYRNTHGGFQSIEDITKVKGIGPKTFDKIREMITVENKKNDK